MSPFRGKLGVSKGIRRPGEVGAPKDRGPRYEPLFCYPIGSDASPSTKPISGHKYFILYSAIFRSLNHINNSNRGAKGGLFSLTRQNRS
jgi:hypothetical protein